jgi:hypothetical protein
MTKLISTSYDFQDTNKISGLPISTANGEAVVHQQLQLSLTRADLNTAATNNALTPGRIYVITDEQRLAVANTTNTYTAFVRETEINRLDVPPEYRGHTYGLVLPGNTTSVTQLGVQGTTSGTISNPAISAGTHSARTRRFLLTTTATAGNVAHWRASNRPIWRGNGIGRGGFWCRIVGGVDSSNAAMRVFFGITDLNATATNISGITDTTLVKVGVAVDTNSGNWQAINGLAGATPTVTDLGTDFGYTSSEMLQVDVYCLPNPGLMSMTVKNLNTGIATTIPIGNSIPGTTFLTPTAWISNNTAASAVAIAIGRIEFHSPN